MNSEKTVLFSNGNLVVRELEEQDKPLLAKWLSNPQVLEFYEGRDNPFDIDKVHKEFFDSEDDVAKCIVQYYDLEIGYIQYYRLDERTKKKYRYISDAYGMDQFIGEVAYWNKGIGSLLVSSMVNYLMEEMNVDRVVMDPQVRNKRAIKCYEKCGFKKVKILPEHELHEGVYQDCWLIEYRRS